MKANAEGHGYCSNVFRVLFLEFDSCIAAVTANLNTC